MRKQCRRKIWKLVNPIEHAISGAAITSGPDLDKVRLRELGSIEALCKGYGTVEDWNNVRALSNVAQIMAEKGVCPEVMEPAENAQRHLAITMHRYRNTGRMGLTGEAMQAIRDLYEYHDLQRLSISRSEYERHLRLAIAYEASPNRRKTVDDWMKETLVNQ